MKIHSGEQPTMSREEMADDYLRLKLEYTRLHEDYRRLQSEKDKQLLIHSVVVPKGTLCDVCGSENTIGAPHMGSNCIDCNSL